MAVMISYSTKDFNGESVKVHELLQEDLTKALREGMSFLDVDQLVPGDLWRPKIDSALDRAKVVVFLAGPTFKEDSVRAALADSDSFIRYELLTTRQRGAVLIPVHCGWEPPHKSNTTWPADFQWLNDHQWKAIELTTVRHDLGTIVEAVCYQLAALLLQEATSGGASLARVAARVFDASPAELNAVDFILKVLRNSGEIDRYAEHRLVALLRVVNPLSCQWFGDSIPTRADPLLQVLLSIADRRLVDLSGLELGDLVRHMKPTPTDGVDLLLHQFVRICLNRSLERVTKRTHFAPDDLTALYSAIRSLKRSERTQVMRIIENLLKYGIRVEVDDRRAFSGSENLKSLIRYYTARTRQNQSRQIKDPRTGKKAGTSPRANRARTDQNRTNRHRPK